MATTIARGGIGAEALIGIAVLVVGAAIVYAILAGWARGEPKGGTPAADLATVSLMSFDITTTATGDLQAKNQTVLRSDLDSEATIAELAAEGVFVRKGDLLIRLNVEQVQSQLDEAELRVESARSDLVAADKGYEIQQSENDSKMRQAQLKVDLAQLAMDQWEKGEKVQKLKDIELALDRTKQDLDRLKDKAVQSQKLFDEGFLSKNDLDLDKIALREAEAARAKAGLEADTYNNYQMPKDLKQKTSDLEEAREELKRTLQEAEIQLAIKSAEKTNKKRQLALHEEKRDKLRKQVEAATIIAPQDGLVVYATSAGRNWRDDSPFVVGRRVYPQEELIILPDTAVMVAAVRVHEAMAGRVRPGQAATVKIDAYPGRTFTGLVDSIGVMAESQGRWSDPNRREYTIKIAIDPPGDDTSLKPAMRCEATITLGSVEQAPTVPLQAIFSDEAVRFVYTPSGTRFIRVPIQLGRRSETLAEIKVGVEAGTRVLVREPGPGEVIRTPWDEAKLKLVGIQLGSDGKPVPIGRENADSPQRRARGKGQRPGGGGGGGGGGGEGRGGREPGVRAAEGPKPPEPAAPAPATPEVKGGETPNPAK